jgi:tRNA (cmo5U34)-methyltransferase
MSADTVDHVQPQGAWKFDDDVTRAFDDMLARSIPQYEVMRSATTALACKFAKTTTRIVDYGCSRGVQLVSIAKQLGALNRYVGIDISPPMVDAARAALASIGGDLGEVRALDLRSELPGGRYSVALAVLTLQFVPIEHRQRIVQHIHDTLLPGGAFLFVEKCLGANAALDATFIDLYYDLKQRNGYTDSDIERKRLSLEGVLVPITAEWNESMLHNAGFASVDCYWRWMNFAGWIAVKGQDART